MTALVELRDVTKVFGGGFLRRSQTTLALDNVSMTIPSESPSITAIAGESGSGKTTLARLLMMFTEPTSGTVKYKGQDLSLMSAADRLRFRREVQPIFQDPFEVFNPFYRVDHVLRTPVRKFKLASSEAEGRKLIEEALELVGLRPGETLGRYPHQLSGGQRQRIMVARALLLRPSLIVADEPVSMVDASLRATILNSLTKLNRDLGISVLYITHDLTTAYQICDNIVILYRGSVVEAGSTDRVIRTPMHPYTQLLVSSIPRPDPRTRWGAGESEATPSTTGMADTGCKFASRCPSVMETCWSEPPPFYLPDENRTAACFLYNTADVLDSSDPSDVFVQPQRRNGPVAEQV